MYLTRKNKNPMPPPLPAVLLRGNTPLAANRQARYQWLALSPHAPRRTHQQQVRQAVRQWLAVDADHPPAGLHLSWSYAANFAVVAAAPCQIGVDATAVDALDGAGWAQVLQLYGAVAKPPPTASEAARLWVQIEAADKCLRTGLRECSPAVAQARRRCGMAAIAAPAGVRAALAWLV